MADEEQPDGLTLKKVYDFLVNRLENNLSIDINDTSVSRQVEKKI
jgi:hypothetical protein